MGLKLGVGGKPEWEGEPQGVRLSTGVVQDVGWCSFCPQPPGQMGMRIGQGGTVVMNPQTPIVVLSGPGVQVQFCPRCWAQVTAYQPG